MKTHNNLFGQLVAFESLYTGHIKARRGKREGKNARKSCLRFERELEDNLIKLQHELLSHEYRLSGYRTFPVHEPKTRTITALINHRDRVVQQALMDVLEPIFEQSFISHSYACRAGKGTHAGSDKAQQMMRECLRQHSTLFALKADVHRYFASVQHDRLKALIRRKISCRKTLWLTDTIIDSYHEPGRPGYGIPIGNLTSQLFANIYLDALDQRVKCRLSERWYVRYMDDFIILHHDKDRLRYLRIDIELFLAHQLGLELNNKTQIFPVAVRNGRGLDFLGYYIWPHKRRLRKDSLKRFKRRVRQLQKQYAEGRISLGEIKQQLASWLAHAKHGDAQAAVAKYLQEHPFVRSHTHARRRCATA